MMEENEASTDGIISIMREQYTYVPGHRNVYLVQTFCVGDLLTAETFQNVQDGLNDLRARSLVVSDLCSETKGSRFESGCQLCAEVSALQ